MKLFSHKKGLELPITAIVVLIIAITFLSLVILFIKKGFGTSQELVFAEITKIKDQLRKNLEETGELFVISAGAEIQVKKGTPLDFYIGVRNTAPKKVCYRVAFRCLKPFTPDNTCSSSGTQGAILVGGVEPDGLTRAIGGDKWIPRMNPELDIPSGDIEVSPATLQIAGAVKADTYLMEADIYKALNDEECEAQPNWPTADEPYTSKRFHIIVS
ncbi:hypothetical protein HY490_05210 [Candidatus Woesearchaeota archaeon]|nr:hypothetical protein [Candidatus Woesearchaeota archaeon]